MNFIFHSFLLAVVFVDRTICLPKCRVPKVIFVLIDGCRWNYIENEDLPGFQKLAERGTHASYVTPIFPSNSYPNWYTLVTGLYAENHGFVQNVMYDSEFDDFFLMAPDETAEVPHWWNDAEPIWITAEKNGLQSALYWWDGCNVEIMGRKPTICRKYQMFTDSINADTKETFMTALNLLSKEEIQLVQIYYEPVDYYGHRNGPESLERKKALKDIDAILDEVLSEIDKRGLQNDINLVVVSDHGMTSTDPASVKVIDLYKYLDVTDIRYMVYKDATSMILPHEKKAEKVYRALLGIPGLHVYFKDEIPEKYHVKNHRHTLPIMLVADKGYIIKGLGIPGKSIPEGTSFPVGSHGYDPDKMPDMRGIFYATGPGVRKNYTSDPTSMVDNYNVLCDLLGIHPLPNNGTKNLPDDILVPEELPSTPCEPSSAQTPLLQLWLMAIITLLNFCLQWQYLIITL